MFSVTNVSSAGWMRAAIFLILAMLTMDAFADPSYCTTNQGSVTFNLPSGNFGVARDLPALTRITPWTGMQTGNPSMWSCPDIPILDRYGTYIMSTMTPTGQTYTESGVTYTVYRTTVAGIGLVAYGEAYLSPNWGWYAPLAKPVPAGWQSLGTNTGNSFNSPYNFGVALNLAFVTTGPVTGGTITGGVFGTAGMGVAPLASPTNLSSLNLAGSATFTTLACTTPDVVVPMGTHATSELKGIGTTTTAVPFRISLNNCPAGMAFIQYQINPTTMVVDSSNSVVALDSGSTASGIGVQLLTSAGTAGPLGTTQTLSGYSTATGGSYTIALQARYYQTGSSVTPGTANTGMTFTMTYD